MTGVNHTDSEQTHDQGRGRQHTPLSLGNVTCVSAEKHSRFDTRSERVSPSTQADDSIQWFFSGLKTEGCSAQKRISLYKEEDVCCVQWKSG